MTTDAPFDARFSSWLREPRGRMHKVARAYAAQPAAWLIAKSRR